MVWKMRINHIKLAAIEVTSELYQLRVAYKWDPKGEVKEASKHIRINAAIVPMGSKGSINTDEQDSLNTHEKLKKISNETGRIFVNSL